ncbi:hypothetical protein ACFVUY_42955 [Kitasatospora sp. NPDC058063]|uniref:hypothetical protein n=1 Tax=unclassified Kitasatospora TaxID=2633591 RepID=UPI0036D77F92
MGFFNRNKPDALDAAQARHSAAVEASRREAPLDLTGGRGGRRDHRAEHRAALAGEFGDAYAYAKGGDLHGLNRNPDGSPETAGQHMRREAEEQARDEQRRRRWGRS